MSCTKRATAANRGHESRLVRQRFLFPPNLGPWREDGAFASMRTRRLIGWSAALLPAKKTGIPWPCSRSKWQAANERYRTGVVPALVGLDCRRNGRSLTQDVLFREYQRAAGLFLRRLRRARRNR